jgi:hypothetical protein
VETVLRGNAVEVENLSFCEIPWPSFDDVSRVEPEDITEKCVLNLAFVCHQLHEDIQGWRRAGQIPPLGNAARIKINSKVNTQEGGEEETADDDIPGTGEGA